MAAAVHQIQEWWDNEKTRSKIWDYIPRNLAVKLAASTIARTPGRTVVTQPKVMRPCPHCGIKFSAREMRIHKPLCDAGLKFSDMKLCQHCGRLIRPVSYKYHVPKCKRSTD
jgi:hypothetical protein